MRLKSLKIKNFRSYQEQKEIIFGDMTALIGRNDVGKTTILDALGIFFGHKLCKYEPGDKCVYAGENEDVVITCTFDDLPNELVLDATSTTSLTEEYLLTAEGTLSLSRVFSKGKGAGVVVATCLHPSAKNTKGILLKKNEELKSLAQSLNIQAEDNRSNVSLRSAIYKATGDLKLKEQNVSLNKEDGKEILGMV